MNIALFEFDWKTIGRHLLDKEQDIADIERDEHKELHRRQKVLMVWQEQQGSAATYKKLVDVLCNVGNISTASKVQELASH